MSNIHLPYFLHIVRLSQLAVYRHAEDILNRQFTVMSRTGNFDAVLTADDAFPCDGYAVFEGVPPDKTRKKFF